MTKILKQLKKLTYVLGVIMIMALCLGVVACQKEDQDPTVDHGTLVIEDISLVEGKKAKINEVFTKEAYEITYSFDGEYIKIDNGYVTALSVGTTEVTAITQHHSVTFTVTVTAHDYGTMTVSAPSLFAGETGKLVVKFSNAAYAEEVTDESYAFDSDAIEIENGYVTALRGGEKVNVTVTTAHYTSTFVVRTLIDQGLNVDDVYAWIGYPASEFFPAFDDEALSGNITYTYDKNKISIDAEKQTITALAEGEVRVTAESDHAATSFIVNAKRVDKTTKQFADPTGLKTYAPGRVRSWNNDGIEDKTTIFIGDSFFSPEYWANFYDMYAGKDALCLGVGGSTSYMWESWMDEYFAGIKPKNIVMNMGTNNIYNDEYNEDPTTTALSLQRMFVLMHSKYPAAKIYYFSVVDRGEDTSAERFDVLNGAMQKWCEQRDYITYIDVSNDITLDMLASDKIHPKLQTYSVYASALAQTDIVIEGLPFENLSISFDNTSPFTFFSRTHARKVYYKGEALNDNYILTGKLDITATKSSWGDPFVMFGTDTENNRVLLSDMDKDGTFKLTIPSEGETNVPAEDSYVLTDGQAITLTWKIVMVDGDFFFYIGDELKLVYCDLGAGELLLGSNVTSCRFYDFTVLTNENDSEAYMAAIDQYQDTIDVYQGETGKKRV